MKKKMVCSTEFKIQNSIWRENGEKKNFIKKGCIRESSCETAIFPGEKKNNKC